MDVIMLELENNLSYGCLIGFSGVVCFKGTKQCKYGVDRLKQEGARIVSPGQENNLQEVYKREVKAHPGSRVVLADCKHLKCEVSRCMPTKIGCTAKSITGCMSTYAMEELPSSLYDIDTMGLVKPSNFNFVAISYRCIECSSWELYNTGIEIESFTRQGFEHMCRECKAANIKFLWLDAICIDKRKNDVASEIREITLYYCISWEARV
jgi:hypothetical protein